MLLEKAVLVGAPPWMDQNESLPERELTLSEMVGTLLKGTSQYTYKQTILFILEYNYDAMFCY